MYSLRFEFSSLPMAIYDEYFAALGINLGPNFRLTNCKYSKYIWHYFWSGNSLYIELFQRERTIVYKMHAKCSQKIEKTLKTIKCFHIFILFTNWFCTWWNFLTIFFIHHWLFVGINSQNGMQEYIVFHE